MDRTTDRPREQPNASLQPPRKEDFSSWEDYLDAKQKYIAAATYQQREAENRQRNDVATRQQRDQQAKETVGRVMHVVQTHISNEAQKVAAEYPDYQEVVSNADNIQVPEIVQAAIARSGAAGHIGYYLAKNEALIPQLAQLSPFDLGAAMARLANHFNGRSASSNAPPPGRVSGGRGSTANGYRESFTAAEHLAWEARQAKQR